MINFKLHNDYPLAPEKLAIPHDKLSNYYIESADKNRIKVDDVKKLIPNLGDKTNYLVTKLSSSIYHWGQ